MIKLDGIKFSNQGEVDAYKRLMKSYSENLTLDDFEIDLLEDDDAPLTEEVTLQSVDINVQYTNDRHCYNNDYPAEKELYLDELNFG
jgi:hypothetical protein